MRDTNKPASESLRQFRLGSVNDAKLAATRLLEAVVDGDITREQRLWESFLIDTDRRVQFEAFRLLLSYKYGKPTEKAEVEVKDQTFVAKLPDKHDPDEWRKRYAPKPDGQA